MEWKTKNTGSLPKQHSREKKKKVLVGSKSFIPYKIKTSHSSFKLSYHISKTFLFSSEVISEW